MKSLKQSKEAGKAWETIVLGQLPVNLRQYVSMGECGLHSKRSPAIIALPVDACKRNSKHVTIIPPQPLFIYVSLSSAVVSSSSKFT